MYRSGSLPASTTCARTPRDRHTTDLYLAPVVHRTRVSHDRRKATEMLHRNRDVAIDGTGARRAFPFVSRSPRSNGGVVATLEPALDPAVQQVVAELATDWSTVAADSIDDAVVEGLQRLA